MTVHIFFCFRPFEETQKNNSLFLTRPCHLDSNEDVKDRFNLHRSVSELSVDQSIDHVLELQHGRRVSRKISSDYVKTIDHIEHHKGKIHSIRSVEFAKKRPAISIDEYQKKNREYYEMQMNKVPVDGGPSAAGKLFNFMLLLVILFSLYEYYSKS